MKLRVEQYRRKAAESGDARQLPKVKGQPMEGFLKLKREDERELVL
ncbi:hypothetical protein [Holdemania massiliensis]|nr:hypothetical protein [Holdemania massiliensis]MCH1942552.1 hypothetical protein [Holdemania massiliensis]